MGRVFPAVCNTHLARNKTGFLCGIMLACFIGSKALSKGIHMYPRMSPHVGVYMKHLSSLTRPPMALVIFPPHRQGEGGLWELGSCWGPRACEIESLRQVSLSDLCKSPSVL